MEIFYTPKHARVGDAIPFYDGNQFRIFYLKNWNPYFGSDRTNGWHMLTTRDHLHFEETATGIRGGTGSVIEVNGTYHLFYCVFERNPQRQYICHATSPDLKTWTDCPEDKFGPDESIYLLTDWRDPFVFPAPDGRGWWMLTSAQAQGSTSRLAMGEPPVVAVHVHPAGHLHQVAQGLGKSGLALPAGDKIQLTEQPGHDQQHRNEKQDISAQHRTEFNHLPVGDHNCVHGGKQFHDHAKVDIALGGVGGNTADQRIAALAVVVFGGQAHQLVPQLVAHPQIDLLIGPAAQ